MIVCCLVWWYVMVWCINSEELNSTASGIDKAPPPTSPPPPPLRDTHTHSACNAPHRHRHAMFFNQPGHISGQAPRHTWNSHTTPASLSPHILFLLIYHKPPRPPLQVLSIDHSRHHESQAQTRHASPTPPPPPPTHATTYKHLSSNVPTILNLYYTEWCESNSRYWFVWVDLRYTNTFTVPSSFLTINVFFLLFICEFDAAGGISWI